MSTRIKIFSDKSVLEFDRGKFDDWCVYLTANGNKIAPKDIEYFTKIKNFAGLHGAPKIYDDFVKIYNATSSQIDEKIIFAISKMSSQYGTDALTLDKLFTILYAGMIAEENKQYAKLKKRIKRLGMHQLLIDNFDPEKAANFSRGKNWRTLDIECRNRGF
jgi:hypothetical protein